MILTIFTPTYNRKKLLLGLFDNIKAVTNALESEDFVEWLIVDDGSAEDYSDVISSFEENEHLHIVYQKKENGGKHTAFNIAIDAAIGDVFVCIDDDDRLTSNALKDIFTYAKEFEGKGYGGFVGRVEDENGALLGKTVFEGYLISNTIEIRDKYHFWGEPEVFYTEILKKYHFDVFAGERFLTEAYVFDSMSVSYPFVYTNTIMMVKKYLPDGLTDNQLKIRMLCPYGCESYYYKRKQLCKGFPNKLKASINRQRFGRYASNHPKRRIDLYEIIAFPIAYIMSIKDRHDCPDVLKKGF